MHDDQPLCQKPTERRRTTVRFHGCDAKPLDRDRRVLDTKYAKGRHLGTQQTSQQSRTALSQPFESNNRCNASSICEHCCKRGTWATRFHFVRCVTHRGCRGKRETRGFGAVRIISRVQHPPRRHPKMLLLKQHQTQAVHDKIPAKGCRHLLVKTLGQRHGQGNHVPTVWSHHQRQRRDYRDQQVDPTATDDHRDTVSLQPECGWAHELDPLQDEIDEAKRLLEEAHVEVQAAQGKVVKSACRLGEPVDEIAKLKSLMEANLASAAR